MTLSLPQMTLPEQVQTYVDKAKAIDYRKHYEQTVQVIILIAAWTVAIAKLIHQGWQIAAPWIIKTARGLADFIESLEEPAPTPPLEIALPAEELEPQPSARKPKGKGFQN